jgi:hypothetical protein
MQCSTNRILAPIFFFLDTTFVLFFLHSATGAVIVKVCRPCPTSLFHSFLSFFSLSLTPLEKMRCRVANRLQSMKREGDDCKASNASAVALLNLYSRIRMKRQRSGIIISDIIISHLYMSLLEISEGKKKKERIDNEKDDGEMSRAWSDALRTSPSSSSSSLPSHSMILRPLSIHYFDREMISESSARTLSVTHRGFYLYYVYLSIDIYILI